MKRLLVVFALLGVMLLPQAAVATPFSFGPAGIFDDSVSFSDNIEKLVDQHSVGGTASSVGSLDPAGRHYFTGIGYSEYAKSVGGVSLFVDKDPQGNMSVGYDIAGKHRADAINLRYWDDDEMSMLSINLTDGWLEVMQADKAVDVSINGVDYHFAEGTLFIGFTFTNGPNDRGGSLNTPDFILAASPNDPTQPVPVPAAVWLMGSGLAGIAALRRKFN